MKLSWFLTVFAVTLFAVRSSSRNFEWSKNGMDVTIMIDQYQAIVGPAAKIVSELLNDPDFDFGTREGQTRVAMIECGDLKINTSKNPIGYPHKMKRQNFDLINQRSDIFVSFANTSTHEPIKNGKNLQGCFETVFNLTQIQGRRQHAIKVFLCKLSLDHLIAIGSTFNVICVAVITNGLVYKPMDRTPRESYISDARENGKHTMVIVTYHMHPFTSYENYYGVYLPRLKKMMGGNEKCIIVYINVQATLAKLIECGVEGKQFNRDKTLNGTAKLTATSQPAKSTTTTKTTKTMTRSSSSDKSSSPIKKTQSFSAEPMFSKTSSDTHMSFNASLPQSSWKKGITIGNDGKERSIDLRLIVAGSLLGLFLLVLLIILLCQRKRQKNKALLILINGTDQRRGKRRKEIESSELKVAKTYSVSTEFTDRKPSSNHSSAETSSTNVKGKEFYDRSAQSKFKAVHEGILASLNGNSKLRSKMHYSKHTRKLKDTTQKSKTSRDSNSSPHPKSKYRSRSAYPKRGKQ